jgi:hypothetical protein
MARLSKLFQLILECIGGVFFELACLFAPRKMEEIEAAHRKQLAQREAMYNARINELKNSTNAHIKAVSALLHQSNIERQRLQDRLLHKAGSLPIFEQREESRADPQQVQSRDRVTRVTDRTKTAIEEQKKVIKNEVDEYLQDLKSEGSAE